MLFFIVAFVLYLEAFALAALAKVLFDGRVPLNFTEANFDASDGPFLTIVKGTETASHYFQLPGTSVPKTPLWNDVKDQPILVLIDNSSVFSPGGAAPQLGFRRSELIAQESKSGNRTAFDEILESGVTAFHFSVQADTKLPLNNAHEYQAVFIEKADGTHVFDLQTGTPFNTTLNAAAAGMLRIRSHNSTVLFATPFDQLAWHNFAVVVDWDKLTLQVFHSLNGDSLVAVTNAEDNSSVGKGAAAQGDVHFGLLKLPLIDPSETPAKQGDVAHSGKQEGDTEGLIYSGTFIEDTKNGVSLGCRANN